MEDLKQLIPGLTDKQYRMVALIISDVATVALMQALQLIEDQAEDNALWFKAQTAPEAYLQQALRKLHGTVEEGCGVQTSYLGARVLVSEGTRLHQAVRLLLDAEVATLSRAAELLGIGVADMRTLANKWHRALDVP